MKVMIETKNAAFSDACGPCDDSKGRECARILRELADKLEGGRYPERGEVWHLYDVNGNKVGTVRR